MNKSFLIKIYDDTGVTLQKTLTKVKNIPSWNVNLNGVYGDTSIELNESFDNIPSYATLNNIVLIYEVSDDYPTGKLVYKGYISEIRPSLRGSSEEVSLGIRGIGDLLKNAYLKNGASYSKTYTTTDISDVFEDIVDHFNTIYTAGFLSYVSGTTIETTGLSITYTVEEKKHIDALNELHKFCDPAWYWYVDATGVVYLKESSAGSDHTFTIQKDVEVIEPIQTVEKIVNRCHVIYTGGNTTVSDATSITNYGLREQVINDTNITDSTTAGYRATKVVTDNRNPKVTGKLRVNSSYDITTINVGDTCKLRNYNVSGSILQTEMLIVSVSYGWDYVDIELGENRSNIARILDMFIGNY